MLNKLSKDWEKNNLPHSLAFSEQFIKRHLKKVYQPKDADNRFFEVHTPLTHALTVGFPEVKIEEDIGYEIRLVAGGEYYCLEINEEIQDWLLKFNKVSDAKIPTHLLSPIKIRINWIEGTIDIDRREIYHFWEFRESELAGEMYCNSNGPEWRTYCYTPKNDCKVHYIRVSFHSRSLTGAVVAKQQLIPIPEVSQDTQNDWKKQYPEIRDRFITQLNNGDFFTRVKTRINAEIW